MSRKPDYLLKVLNKCTEAKGHVGAGWKNADGSITFVLNPCVVLSGNDSDILITAFMNDYNQEKAKSYRKSKAAKDSANGPS